jgi:hypothetical protein
MGKSLSAAGSILALIYNATAWTAFADNAASSPNTNIYVSLHTADPGTGGSQTTNECGYTSYARQAVARTSGGWTVTSNSVSPAANVDFPAATGSPTDTVTHFATGKSSTSTGLVLHAGTVTPNIAVTSAGVIPRLTTATAITEA